MTQDRDREYHAASDWQPPPGWQERIRNAEQLNSAGTEELEGAIEAHLRRTRIVDAVLFVVIVLACVGLIWALAVFE